MAAHRRAMLLALSLCSGCFRDSSAGAVARRFLDKYYLEIDQPAALALATGPAAGRIRDELVGLERARQEGLEANPTPPRMFYEKLPDRPSPGPGKQELEYRLSIDSGGVRFHKRVDLQLEDEGGHWRVFRFAETDMAEAE